jgi:creatinine amidohydrolase
MERRLGNINHLELKDLVPARIDTVLVPVGTIEAHGIVPLATDVIIPQALADRICEDVNALVAPAVPYGITRGLVGHPGTVSIRPDIFKAYVHDLLKSLADAGFTKIVVLNGHGGQTDELKDVLFEVSRTTPAKTLLIDWWYETDEIRKQTLEREGGHAGADETAAIVAIDGTLVKPDLYRDDMVMRYGKSFSAYPFPGSIITYTEGDGSLNLDPERCKAYFDQVTARITGIIKEVLAKWDRI